MKVTVCFGRTGIVVPCKEGQLCVRELTQQALQRYLKTREKVSASWGRRRGRGCGAGIRERMEAKAPARCPKDWVVTLWLHRAARRLDLSHYLWPQLLNVANIRDLGVWPFVGLASQRTLGGTIAWESRGGR